MFVFKNNLSEGFKSHFIMGIVNLSQDSFFPPSRVKGLNRILDKVESMIVEGVDVIDIGAESSRPGSKPLSVKEESQRLMEVVPLILKRFSIPISIDTYKPEVARQVLDAGVSIINDITGLQHHPEMSDLISEYNAGVVVMHMKGTPDTMQTQPQYDDVVPEIIDYIKASIKIAEESGIHPSNIAVDPGIGFGKTTWHNLEILNRLEEFKVLNKPLLIGVSRKSFIGALLDLPVENRLEGSLAASVIAFGKGASIFRVHDVKETVRAIRTAESIFRIKGKVNDPSIYKR